MAETEDLTQLRQLNLALLRQLWAGQDAVRRLVIKAASESSLDSSHSYSSATPLSPKTSSASSSASCSQDRSLVCDPPDGHRGDTCDTARLGGASSRVTSLSPATCQHPESLGGVRPHSAPLPVTGGLKEFSTGLEHPGVCKTQVPRSILGRQSKPSKLKVTFCQESAVPESSWRFRPFLGYDWIAGSLDSSSLVSSESEAFFSTLQKFRDCNKEDCFCDSPKVGFPRLHESDDIEEDHECVYCYRVNRRLFPEPADPGAPCRLCGIPRDQRNPETLAEPAQVRVSIPLCLLDPPHQYRVHRRKSFDASDTLALPRHCLLGWDILPPKSEKGSALKSLDLWSSVSSGVQHQQLLGPRSSSCLAMLSRVPPPTPIWSEPQVPRLRIPQQKP
uniref:migration and invasion-inhibitory protein isoform X2 n=1 Tax=Jaculus jaculus TaxID=51337 RepID=UPI001E1B30BE|nr:migration and invasion-inhibitory protein isoform X2 [Jaculus jaculus]